MHRRPHYRCHHTGEGRRTVETVTSDEVHAVAGTKRGSHLALSLERLEQLHEIVWYLEPEPYGVSTVDD